MKQIELFEKMIEKYETDGTDIDDQLKAISEDWNLRRLWDAYHHAKACESPYISFNDFFREKEEVKSLEEIPENDLILTNPT